MFPVEPGERDNNSERRVNYCVLEIEDETTRRCMFEQDKAFRGDETI